MNTTQPAHNIEASDAKSDSELFDSLRGPEQFDPVFTQGAKYVQGSVTLRLLKRNDGVASTRLGLITPKKKTKLAVFRNAFKRVARDTIRHAAKAGGLSGCDVVIQFSGLVIDHVDLFKAAARKDLDMALAKALDPASSPSPRQARRGPRQ
jgi:ribonuclease P protein component